MVSLTLSRTLKIKNRVVERLAKVRADIKANNSRIQGAEYEVSIPDLTEEETNLINDIVGLKLAIEKGSEPIRYHILILAEFKGQITFWEDVPTLRGKQIDSGGWGDPKEIIYESVKTKAAVDATIKEAKKQIDTIQETIDNHNQVTKINVSDHLLDL